MMELHRACDACYSRKRRCSRSDTTKCIRCEKLGLLCTTTRRLARTGRPPSRRLRGSASLELGVWDPVILSPLGEQERERKEEPKERGNEEDEREEEVEREEEKEERIIKYSPVQILNPEIGLFYALSDIYMFGSTFASSFYQAMGYCYHHSPELLTEGFTATQSSISWARYNLLTFDQVDVSSGAVSVRKLRDAVIADAHDALAVLMLGQALAAFDTLLISDGAIPILRHALSLIQPWYADLARVDFLDPITIAPVFWDTLWCLLHREVPIVRPLLRPTVIDRVAGLCTSLLPILYDLCVVSHAMRSLKQKQPDLDRIEDRILAWTPDTTLLDSPSASFTREEILSMHTQARMYRAAALLLIQQLRHAGHDYQTATSLALATEILETWDRFFAQAGADAKLQNTSFPLSLALLYIPLCPSRFWESGTRLCVRPACVDRLLSFHAYFWSERESGNTGSVFELVKSGPSFTPIP